MAKLQAQLRNDPTLEQTARREWVKLCRSISLGPAGPNMPALWLEVKPTQAVMTQPKVDPNWLIVTGGVITSAGVVLAGTFLVMAAMPMTVLTEIGFAIAIGVLIWAFVRSAG